MSSVNAFSNALQTTFFSLGLAASLACAIAGAAIARERGANPVGSLWRFVFGPLGIVVSLVLRPLEAPLGASGAPSDCERACPFCRRLVACDAALCLWCWRDIEPRIPEWIGVLKARDVADRWYASEVYRGYERCDRCKLYRRPEWDDDSVEAYS